MHGTGQSLDRMAAECVRLVAAENSWFRRNLGSRVIGTAVITHLGRTERFLLVRVVPTFATTTNEALSSSAASAIDPEVTMMAVSRTELPSLRETVAAVKLHPSVVAVAEVDLWGEVYAQINKRRRRSM